MDPRRTLTAVGAAITTFLLVAVLVIELLDFEFSAVIGLPVGLFTGLLVLVVLLSRLSEVSPSVQRAASAYATFGSTVLTLSVLKYVNIGRSMFTTDVLIGTGLVASVLAYILLWALDTDPI